MILVPTLTWNQQLKLEPKQERCLDRGLTCAVPAKRSLQAEIIQAGVSNGDEDRWLSEPQVSELAWDRWEGGYCMFGSRGETITKNRMLAFIGRAK